MAWSFGQSIIDELRGKNARKDIQRGTQAANAANAAAATQAANANWLGLQDYLRYGQEAMGAIDAGQANAANALTQGYGGATQQLIDRYNQSQQASQPYIDSIQQLLGTSGDLLNAMGIGGGTYNVQASPMYQWQKQAMDNELAAQLAASGLSPDSAQAAYIRSQGIGQLGAQESERQIANLMQTAQMALPYGQYLGQSDRELGGLLYQGGLQQGAGLSDIYSQAARDKASLYGGMGEQSLGVNQNIGQIYGGSLAQEGQNLYNSGIAQSNTRLGLGDLLNTAANVYGISQANKKRSPVVIPQVIPLTLGGN